MIRRPSVKSLLNRINKSNKTVADSDIVKDMNNDKTCENLRKNEGEVETGGQPKTNNLYFLKDHPLKIIERCNKMIREEEKKEKMKKVSRLYRDKKIEMYEMLDNKEIKLLEVFDDVVEVIMELGRGEEKDYKIFKILNCCNTNIQKEKDGLEYMIYAGYVWKFGKE